MVQFKKLTVDLFLASRGHNVHRQQRQLSKFSTRYQQFASLAYCGAAGLVYKIASQQEKAFVFTVQREFRARFRKNLSHTNNITRWYGQFVETKCLCKGNSPGRPRVSDDNIERAREAFQRSPCKSVTGTSRY
jgi:hypothetical protein